MAPKNNAKGGDKKGAAGKGKGKDAGNDDKSKVKGAQSINVRHILVSAIPDSLFLSRYFRFGGVPVASTYLDMVISSSARTETNNDGEYNTV